MVRTIKALETERNIVRPKRFKQNFFRQNIKFGVLYQLTKQNIVWQRHLAVYLVNASVAFLETITCCRVDFHSCSVTAIVVVGALAFKVSILHDDTKWTVKAVKEIYSCLGSAE